MKHPVEDIEYAEYLFDRFYSIGSTENGGVTRLGYTETEDEMHKAFVKLGEEKGYKSSTDEVGNTYLYDESCKEDEDGEYYLVASHLDSVVEGGRYDGVSGIIAGLLILNWAKQDGIRLPLHVGAMRCEESSNFGRSTIGSGSFDRGLAVRTSSGANSSVGVFARISGLNDRRVISFPGRAADSVAVSVADIAAGSVAAW